MGPEKPVQPSSSSTELPDVNPLSGDLDSQFEKPSFDVEEPHESAESQPDELPTPVVATAGTPPKSKFSQKRTLLIVLIATLVAIGGAGSVFAFWYNKPTNVLDDMLQKLVLTEQGSASGYLDNTDTSKDSSLSRVRIDFAAAFDKAGNSSLGGKISAESNSSGQKKTFGLNLDMVASSDDKFYIKAEPLKKIINDFIGPNLGVYESLVSKVDGKWLVVTPKDIQNDGQADKQTTCASNALKSFGKDSAQQKEVSELYQKHRFVLVGKNLGIEMVNGTPANHYEIKLDSSAAKAFADALPQTAIFKKVDACFDGALKKTYDEQKDSVEATTSGPETTQSSTELWVDAVSHQLLKAKITSKNSTQTGLAEASFKLNQPTTVTVPKADVTVDDLKAEIDRIQQQVMNSYLDTPGGSPVLGARTTSAEQILTGLFR